MHQGVEEAGLSTREQATSERGSPSARGTAPPPNATQPTKMPPRTTWAGFALILLVNYILMSLFMPNPDAPVTVPYTLFKEEAGKGNVEAIYSRADTLTGRFKSAVTYPAKDEKGTAAPAQSQGFLDRLNERVFGTGNEARAATTFVSILPAFVDPGLETFLIKNGVEISAKPI